MMIIRLAVLAIFFWSGLIAVDGGTKETKPFPLPLPVEVVAFTNGGPPATGDRTVKRKEEILRFLKYGKPKWHEVITYGYEPEKGYISACDGVFLDNKGRFYFWSFNSPKVLVLTIPDGRYVHLDLRK